MNLREMEVFRAVMRAGTVKAAADLLHVSQPAASKLLAQAERRSGLKLFDRVKGRLVPTPQAHLLYPDIEAVWKTVEKANDVARELADPQGGTLRLGASSRFCTFLIPHTVSQLFEAMPGLSVRVEMIMPHLLADALLSGAVDLGVTQLPTIPHGLSAVREYACGLVCVMPADHALARKRVVHARDLRNERLIAFSKAPPLGEVLEPVHDPELLRGSGRVELEVSSGPIACWFVQAGTGIAVVDASTLAGQPFTGLAVRPFRPSPRLHARILRSAYRPLSRSAEAFCERFDALWQEHVRG